MTDGEALFEAILEDPDRVTELVPFAGALDTAGAARVAAANPFPALQTFAVCFRISEEGLAALFGCATTTSSPPRGPACWPNPRSWRTSPSSTSGTSPSATRASSRW
jgi:hypothetical protein